MRVACGQVEVPAAAAAAANVGSSNGSSSSSSSGGKLLGRTFIFSNPDGGFNKLLEAQLPPEGQLHWVWCQGGSSSSRGSSSDGDGKPFKWYR